MDSTTRLIKPVEILAMHCTLSASRNEGSAGQATARLLVKRAARKGKMVVAKESLIIVALSISSLACPRVFIYLC